MGKGLHSLRILLVTVRYSLHLKKVKEDKDKVKVEDKEVVVALGQLLNNKDKEEREESKMLKIIKELIIELLEARDKLLVVNEFYPFKRLKSRFFIIYI